MTLPRPVYRGDTVHIQRRTRDGRFFLVPRPETIALVRYAYALAAERYNLTIHALCIMSTHLHVIVTDHEAKHPRFTEFAHRTIALGLKAMYGIEGAVWDEAGVSVQRLIGRTAIVEALSYLRMNPVAAACVPLDRMYPAVFGVDDRAPLERSTTTITRPSCFRMDSAYPSSADFSLEPPATVLEELGEEGAARAIVDAVQRHREEARKENRQRRRQYLGMKRVLSTDVWTRAGALKRAELKPRFKGVVREAIRKGLIEYQQFLELYFRALDEFKGGNRDVIFPLGTYQMRIRGCRAYV